MKMCRHENRRGICKKKNRQKIQENENINHNQGWSGQNRLLGGDDSESDDGADQGDPHKTHYTVEVSPPSSLEVSAL